MDSRPSPNDTTTNPSANSAKGWRAFDRIYCISVADREDRRRSAQARFDAVGLGGLVEFMIVERHPTNSEQGIYESHIACLRAGLATGARTIVIFEDDILFERFSPQTLRHAVDFMHSGGESSGGGAADGDGGGWDLFFFGCFVKSSSATRYPSVLKIRYQCTTHAYAVSREFAEKLVQIPWQGVAYDDMLRSLADARTYVLYPAFAYQDDSPSDNDKTIRIDRTRRLLGGMRRLQRWNEFSHRHIIALILGHIAVISLIVLMLILASR